MDFHAGHQEVGPRTAKRHLPHPAMCKEWDFLKGSGPSAPQAAFREEHKYKPAPFHSAWNRKKPESAIGQYDERKEKEAVKNIHNSGCQEVRRDHLQRWNVKNQFNPVTGQELDTSTGTWGKASDPWRHQRPGLKPVKQPGMSPEAMEAKALSAEVRRQMRADRIANDGLTASRQIRTTSVRDNFIPTNM